MAPLTELDATSPPAMLASPACTLPRATDERIVPELLPTKPPAWRLATLGLPTATDATEFEIEPVFTAASPPSVVNPLVPATPATSPVADAFVMVPLFKPTSPPPLPFAPTLTATSVAEMLLIEPAFVPASVPANWEFRPLTVTSARLRLRTTPVLPQVPNSPAKFEIGVKV